MSSEQKYLTTFCKNGLFSMIKDFNNDLIIE